MGPDPSLSLETIFRLVEIASVLGGGALLAFRFGSTTSRLESSIDSVQEEMAALKVQQEKLVEIITNQALLNQRMVQVGDRLNKLENWYDELRRGEGFVFPLWHDRNRPGLVKGLPQPPQP